MSSNPTDKIVLLQSLLVSLSTYCSWCNCDIYRRISEPCSTAYI